MRALALVLELALAMELTRWELVVVVLLLLLLLLVLKAHLLLEVELLVLMHLVEVLEPGSLAWTWTWTRAWTQTGTRYWGRACVVLQMLGSQGGCAPRRAPALRRTTTVAAINSLVGVVMVVVVSCHFLFYLCNCQRCWS